jgi:hypothetical protein
MAGYRRMFDWTTELPAAVRFGSRAIQDEGTPMRLNGTILRWALAVAVAGLMASVPATAGAVVKNEYAPSKNARTFANGLGGWTESEEYDGVCIPGLTCPAIDNSFQSSGGAGGAGDGFIETGIGDLLGVSSEARGIWDSPAFRYRGAGGEKPDKLRFLIDRKSDHTTLLSVGGKARYKVLILNAGGTVSHILINNLPLSPTEGFLRVGPIRLGRSSLDVGRRYRIRIISRFSTPVDVLDGGETGYDNVKLIAKRRGKKGGGGGGKGGGGGGKGGGGGGKGGGGGGGKGGGGKGRGGRGNRPCGRGDVTRSQLRRLARRNGTKRARIRNRRARVVVRNRRSTGVRCRVRVSARIHLRRHGPRATHSDTARLGSGDRKKLRLRTRPRFRDELRSRRRAFLRQRVSAGGRTARVNKRIRLRH